MHLGHRLHLGEVTATQSLERIGVTLQLPHVNACRLDQPFGFEPRFADHDIGLARGLLLRRFAHLLRGDQGFVERLVSLAKGAQLFVECPRLGVEFLVRAHQSLDLVGDLLAKLVDPRRVVAAKRRTKFVAPDINRREMKPFVSHGVRSPNRTVPSRTIVAPSSTATS